MTNAEKTMSQYERHRLNVRRYGQVNKVAIFDALAAQNITKVLVEFDGESDQGQIESVIVVRDGERVAMPKVTVTLRRASWGSSEPDISECALRVGIETLCYDFLEEEHGGWRNNDGAFGQFHLDVSKRTVELEFNGCFPTSRPLITRSEGGENGASLSSFAVKRPQMGQHGRRLSAHP